MSPPKYDRDHNKIDINRVQYGSKQFYWSDLIEEFRLIILSEAGSGKTSEIRNIARSLEKQGKKAFFLRIEHIPRDFEIAFEVGSNETFEKWLASNEEGWILLDSVDEARLRNPDDFELAIRRLGYKLRTALDRTHITITSRVTAWRPKTDLDCCRKHLPYGGANISEIAEQFQDDRANDSVPTGTDRGKNDQQDFKFFTFEDLTRVQITAFVKEQGIEDSQAFLDAVERANVWPFTSRPQDLEELAKFWLDKGHIGSRLEFMQNSIERRLAERDQNHAVAHPLSAERARQGVRLLAAATTLIQDQTIRIPDGAENSIGITVSSVLPDWNERDLSTLLSRPIFDEAIYGAVRFHHRTVREYLAAEWFAELLKRTTSRRNIEVLFFDNQYGLDIVVPTLRPLLPWLVIWDENIRDRVCEVAPEIIFEGGDPGQLPLEVRTKILHTVCEEIANGSILNASQEYASVQRFAHHDLANDIRSLLRKHKGNEELTAFLLHMVWLGRLSDTLPEIMDVALNPTAKTYIRMRAFRAIKAIGTISEQEHIRHKVLTEAVEINRDLFAELIDGIPHTDQLKIILEYLQKSEAKQNNILDLLTNVLTGFAETASIELLPSFISHLGELLSLSPTFKHHRCEISKKFRWLIKPASKAVERLIVERHLKSLETDVLEILRKFSIIYKYDNEIRHSIETRIPELIPEWQELNRSLFWFEVQKTRERLAKKSTRRLTTFWEVQEQSTLWWFNNSDFESVSEEISEQTFLDDQLVALSLAISLYRQAKMPTTWLTKLQKVVDGNKKLSQCLDIHLERLPQNQDVQNWEKQNAIRKRHTAALQEEEEKHHAEQKKYLEESLEEIKATLHEESETIPDEVLYLHEQAQKNRNSRSRWAVYNWKSLIHEYGERVAHFYRDYAVSHWRNHDPGLRSESAIPNRVTCAAILGLIGLEIELYETPDWPDALNKIEVELACRYSSFELNGFPTWFPKLFEAHPNTVIDFLAQEIQRELSVNEPFTEAHSILDDVSWSGQWVWEQLAPRICDLIKKEPKSLSDLDKLLKIIQGSTISNELISKVASRKCRTLKKPDHLARWYAVWTGVAPEAAIPHLESRIEQRDDEPSTLLIRTYMTQLLGGSITRVPFVRQAFKEPQYLKQLYLMMQKHFEYQDYDDTAKPEVHFSDLRSSAKSAWHSLITLLIQIPGKEAFLALRDIANTHSEEESRQWTLHRAKTKAEQDGVLEPWSPAQVHQFNQMLERTPRTHKELAELAVFRLLDLKNDLENGDSSIAGTLQRVDQETEMRKFIGRELREKSFGRYNIPQEEELADDKRIDLRFQGMGFDGPVPVELKIADKWTGPKLFERLENQLCGDYLRDNRSSLGIFLLVNTGSKKHWEILGNNERVDFENLIVALQDYWNQISPQFPNIDDITIIGIDLTLRNK